MQYAPLFRIECLHEYFGGGVCRSLNLSPTDDCRALLERYRMLFRNIPGGGAVYAVSQTPPELLRQFDESTPFTFRLTSTDAALDSYTDLGPGAANDPSQCVFYFDNAADQQAEVFGSRRQLLHPPNNPFARTGALVRPLPVRPLFVRPKIFGFTPPSNLASGSLQVIEPLTRQVLWQYAPGDRAAPFVLDLRRLPEGCYTLAMGNQELERFYLSDRPAAQQWGVISIYAGGSRQSANLPRNCQVLDSVGVVTPKTFTLALESRRTIWRYYVIDPADKQDFEDYELIATPGKPGASAALSVADLRFARLPETRAVDGHLAWVFESHSPLPLLQTPSSEFSLVLRPSGNGKRRERTIRLPYAQTGSLVFKDGSGPRVFCSEIFVYV